MKVCGGEKKEKGEAFASPFLICNIQKYGLRKQNSIYDTFKIFLSAA